MTNTLIMTEVPIIMKDGHKYNLEYPQTIVLIRSGQFCYVFDDAALALVALTDYQTKTLKSGHMRCGFPLTILKEIKLALIHNHLSYIDLQTNTTNEQTEIMDRYDAGDPYSFNVLKEQGRKIFKAKQQAAVHVSAAKNDLKIRTGLSDISEFSGKEGSNGTLPSSEWIFIDSLCRGIHPFTQQNIKELNIDDPEIIRALFLVRDKLK